MQPSESRREPEVLRDLRPAVERGRHVAMLAAAGSGHELVFLEAAEAARESGGGLQALLLVPTRNAALRFARLATDVLAPDDTARRLLVWPPFGSSDPTSETVARAEVIVGRPRPLLREIRAGRLGTADLRLICVDAARELVRLGEWPAAEALLDTAEPETRKVVATSSFAAEPLASLLERQLARARRWPEELFSAEPETETRADSTGKETLWYGAAAREEERLDLLAGALVGAGQGDAAAPGDEAGPVRSAVVCADPAAVARVGAGLEARGVRLAEDTSSGGTQVRAEAESGDAHAEGELSLVARWGAPDELAAYTERLPEARRRAAIIDTAHLTQLGLLARRAGWQLHPLPPAAPELAEAAERFRAAVAERLEGGDVSAELLLLQPLFEEHSAAAVAAALAASLREGPKPVEGEPAGRPPSTFAAGPRRPGLDDAVLPAWRRIFLSVGKRDGAGPGDIVGAITGETGAGGGQIGLIEVRPTFTLVDVDAEIAERVIERLNGVRIKSRTVTARPDRDAGGRRGREFRGKR